MSQPPTSSALARSPSSTTPPASGPSAAPERYAPAPYRPSRIWAWLYQRFFRFIQVDPQWERTVREAAARGVVVYVARSVSFLDFLALDFLAKKYALPLIEWCNDVGLMVLEPFGRGSRRMRMKRALPEDQALADTIREGRTPLLFVRRPPAIAAARNRGTDLDVDLIRTLVEMQRRIERPIVLVPQTFVWTKRPPTNRRTIVDLFFGPAEWPGRIRVLLQFLFNYKNALMRSGEPFDVGAFLSEHQEMTDAQAADAIRYAILRRMERERSLVLGPAKKTASRIIDELMRSPRVRRNIEREAKDGTASIAAIEREARRDLDKLCADPDVNVIDLFHRFVERFLWNRIYDGLVVDLEGLERVRESARKGPLVLLPSHKSHIDYLILSDVLYSYGLAPPLIAAGDNLSFFPLGSLLRRSGAFFIKRSFKGKKLYPQLVDAYIRKILVEGHNLELFVEGGRSRTGKLLPPKLGILSMIVDAALQLRDREIGFVPVSIGYERIIEEKSYVHEQSGGEKKPESIGGLLGARRVLRSKYGRLYLEFGDVMSFQELVGEARELAGRNDAARGDASEPGESALSPAQRRALVQRIAHRVTYEINRATVVTPAALCATALMAHRRRGITHGQLVRGVTQMLASLQRLGARIADPVLDGGGTFREETLHETLRLFGDARLLEVVDTGSAKKAPPSGAVPPGPIDEEAIYAVPEERRIALEYHKNTILHFFVPSALIASALLALGDDVGHEALRERVRTLSRLFKLEFMYRADADFDEIFSDALGSMQGDGEIQVVDGVVRRGGGAAGARVASYAEMLRTYFEAYRIAVLSVRDLRDEKPAPLTKKEWLKATLALGQRRWLTGQTTLRESVSRPKIENALAALHDQQIVRIEGDTIRAGAAIGAGYEPLDRMLVEHLMID